MNDFKTIYFVRHGTPVNHLSLLAGVTDFPLSEEGKAGARKTGKWFASENFDGVVYSSPLSRAYDTGKIIADEIENTNGVHHDIKVVDLLMECDFGLLETMSMDDAIKNYPEETKEWYSDPFNNKFPPVI